MEVGETLIDNQNSITIFKTDYKNQKLEDNINFQKFKQTMLSKNDNKGRIFYCKNEDIYFYYNDSKYPYYHGICPSCNRQICYFCKKVKNSKYDLCCNKKRIHYIFSVDAYIFIKYPKDGANYQFKENLLFAIIPLVNLIYFAAGIHIPIYKLDTKIKYKYCLKVGDDYNYDNDYYNLEQYTMGGKDHLPSFILIVIMDVSATIILSIPYLFLDIAFTILIFLISIPFKFYPVKYIYGIGFAGWKLY